MVQVWAAAATGRERKMEVWNAFQPDSLCLCTSQNTAPTWGTSPVPQAFPVSLKPYGTQTFEYLGAYRNFGSDTGKN